MKVSNGTITIELRRATIWDGWEREALVERLKKIDGRSEREISIIVFARVATQSAKAEGLPFSLPTSDLDDTALGAAWIAWARTIDEEFEIDLTNALGAIVRNKDSATGPLPLPEGVEKNS